MKPHCRFLLILFSAFSASIPCAALNVIVDPGHGGVDTGAVYNSTKEAALVLKISKELVAQLGEEADIHTKLTRDTDQLLPLPERARIAEEFQADLFISLHANATVDRKAKGFELYFQNSLPPDEDTLRLASLENQPGSKSEPSQKDYIRQSYGEDSFDQNLEPSKKNDIAAILDDLKNQDRIMKSLSFTEIVKDALKPLKPKGGITIKQAPFFVISKTNMPSILIEVGFISNAAEAARLSRPEQQKQIASQIKQAVLNYRNQVFPSKLQLSESTNKHLN